MVHRDIKPENILLQDGAALVADFGIALAVHQAGGNRMTQTGMSLGTPAYMSPEQAMGEREIGARSDVYALGAMTYEMLAGEPPFTGPNSQAIVAKVLTEQPPAAPAQAADRAAGSRGRDPDRAAEAAGRPLGLGHASSATRWRARRRSGAGRCRRSCCRRRAQGARRRRGAAGRWPGRAGSSAGVAAGVAAWALRRPRPELPPSRLAILVPGLGGSGASSPQRHLGIPARRAGRGLRGRCARTAPSELVRQALDAEAGDADRERRGMGSPLVSPDGRWIVGSQARHAAGAPACRSTAAPRS